MTNSLEKAIEIIIKSVDPDKIILFGSRARGNYKKESDYDLCIIKKGVGHRRKLAQRIYRFLYGVGVPVDIIVETPERFEELKDNPFMVYKEISKYGRVVYEKPVSG
jgi:predicted nucleotidyltransferase